MKKFLLGTAMAVTLISSTSVAFAESNLSTFEGVPSQAVNSTEAFDGIPSEAVPAKELESVSGKGTTYRTGSGKVLSFKQVQKIFAYKPGVGGYSPYTGKYIYPF